MKQKRSNRTRRNSKKTRKAKIKTRQQGRKKKQEWRKIKREREVKKPRRTKGDTKGDTEKWTQTTLFQGENSVFLRWPQKPPKNKKSWRPTAQKHTCNAALPPIPRRMRTKEKNTQRKRGGCEEDHLRFSKTGSKKKTEKTEKPSAPQLRGRFWQRPQIREKKRHGRAPPARQICARSGHTAKNGLFKTSSVLQPRVFWPLKPNFDKISNIEPYKVVTRGKNYPQDGSAKSSLFDTPKGLEEVQRRESLRNPLFCGVSRVSTSTAVLPQDSRPESRKKGFQEGWPKKRAKNLENVHFAKRSISRFSRHRRFPRKPVTPFRTIKQAVSEDPDRLLTLPRPLINS